MSQNEFQRFIALVEGETVEPGRSFTQLVADFERELDSRTATIEAPANAEGIAPPDVPGRWIPGGYDYKCNEFGVVYYTEYPKPAGIAYHGKSKKSDWYIRYRNTAELHEAIDSYLNSLARSFAEKKATQDARRALDARDHWHVGDIIYNSWGYDQTNIDFYQVVGVTAKFVTLRPIAREVVKQTGWASGDVMPCKDEFTGPPERHAAYAPDHVRFQFGCGSRHDGKPKGYTSYA